MCVWWRWRCCLLVVVVLVAVVGVVGLVVKVGSFV